MGLIKPLIFCGGWRLGPDFKNLAQSVWLERIGILFHLPVACNQFALYDTKFFCRFNLFAFDADPFKWADRLGR